MYELNILGNEPKQSITWTNENIEVDLYFEYKDNQLGWYLGVKYGETVDYKNIRLTTSPNLLRAYSAYLPFGIMCLTEDGLEPMTIDDFSNGYAKVYMLTKDDCKQVEANYYA